MADSVYIGLLAGLFQLAGYVLYYTHVVKGEGKPNPLTWLMFGYGTVLLTTLELDSMVREAMDALRSDNGEIWQWQTSTGKPNPILVMVSVLILPIVCSIGGLSVAVKIWLDNYKLTKTRWPKEWTIDWSDTDGQAFAVDLGLTVGYLILWAFTLTGDTSDANHKWWVIGFLLVSNATTIPNFIPIFRSTNKKPEEEHPLPWFVWSIAYALLLYPTWVKGSAEVVVPTTWWPMTWDVSFWEFIALMSYPVLNSVLHGLEGVIAYRKKMNNFFPRYRLAH